MGLLRDIEKWWDDFSDPYGAARANERRAKKKIWYVAWWDHNGKVHQAGQFSSWEKAMSRLAALRAKGHHNVSVNDRRQKSL